MSGGHFRPETTAGGPRGFPSTRWSVLKPGGESPGDDEARHAAMEALARMYWRPVYACLRLRWRQTREEAEDATQEFFLWLLEAPILEKADPAHGRFRNFVRGFLENFMRNRIRADQRQRRGGGRKALSLEFGEDPDAFLMDTKDVPPEEVLDRHWRVTVLDQAIERLRTSLAAEGKSVAFEAFSRYDLAEKAGKERPTYARLAQDLEVSPADVDNHLAVARQRLFDSVREIVAESVDGPEALKAEMDFLLAEAGS